MPSNYAERREYRENALFVKIIAVFFAGLSAFSLIGSLVFQEYLWAAGGLGGVLLFGGLYLFVAKRPKKPFLILNGDGFQLVGFQTPMPWTEVASFEVQQAYGSVTVIFNLLEGHQPPASLGQGPAVYKKTGGGAAIVCGVMGLTRPDSALSLEEDIRQRHQNALARARGEIGPA